MAPGASDAVGACLGDDTITALLEGALADDAARGARAHIAGCPACRRLVSAAIDANTSPAPTNPYVGAPPRGLTPGSLIAGKYRVERMLGEGGMGRVYAARQTGLERPVALKILRPELARDAVALTRFHREARLIASLNSDAVVRVHDLGALDTGEPYLVMELLEGEDLGAVVQRGPLPIDQATRLVLAACDALAEAHSLGIVHRDIKPSNLFLTRHGRLKVLDFGVAKLAAPNAASLAMTAEGVVLGSPRYMAPEQITGSRDVDARADIWSLGATLYHLATGWPPFPDPSLEAIFAGILSGRTPPLLANLPPPIAAAIHRAMARDPAARFATVGDFAAALRSPPPAPHAFDPTLDHRARVRPAPPAPARRSRAPVALALGAVAVVAVVLAVARPWARTSRPAGGGSARPTEAGAAAPLPAPANPAMPSAATSAPPTVPTGAGPLGNLDETRLQARLEQLGWTIQQITRERFPGCDHTRLLIDKGTTRNADVYLLACASAAAAASEAARLRHGFPASWVVTDATLVLVVALPAEPASHRLADELLGVGAAGAPALDLYVACFNAGDERVRQSQRSYLAWVDPKTGPTGRERMIEGITPINDYDAGVCTKNLAAALATAGAGPLADATRAYQRALTELIRVVADASTYYAHKDYKDDGFARGNDLHRALMAAFARWDQTGTALRAAWDDAHRAARDPALAAIEQRLGRASEQFVTVQVMNAAEAVIEAGGTAKPLGAAIRAYQAAFDELTRFFGPGLTPGTDTDRYVFRQAADALLVQTKEAARALAAGALPARGDGSSAALLAAYDALVEQSNAITWDGGDTILRRVR